MSIQFKFRSAVSYDVVLIGENRETISIKELKAKIIEQKKLNIFSDFDLVFSDAVSGKEYDDEDFDIPRGASVIIKRVPAEKLHSVAISIPKVENLPSKGSCLLDPSGAEFDEFGTELWLPPAATFQGYNLASRNQEMDNEKAELSCPRLQNLDARNLRQNIPEGFQHIENERILPQKPISEEQARLEKLKNQAAQSFDLPFELNCSLCHKIFKDAVMIPCCQNSFCEKCIKYYLVDKERCPRCSSGKCKIEHLLPNISLRQAIEHFIENRMLADGCETDLCKYIPDGESGIQAKDISCGVTVIQMEPELPHSPTATGKGSNQIFGSFYEPLTQNVKPSGGLDNFVNNVGGRTINSASKRDVGHIDKERGKYAHNVNFEAGLDERAPGNDCEGESRPFNRPKLQNEADSTAKQKRDLCVDAGAGHYKFPPGRQKGDRTCFMCGSPDHFIRDCPAASNDYHMLQTGNCIPGGPMLNYSSPYWNGAVLPPFSPYGYTYGNPGMMPYNLSMVPGSPFAMPTYVPPLYGGLPTPRGSLGMGNNASMFEKRPERPHVPLEPIDNVHPSKRTKHLDEIDDRHLHGEDDYNDHCNYNKQGRSVGYKFHGRREPSESYSQDSSSGRKRKKHKHGKCDDSYTTDARHEKKFRLSPARKDRRLSPSVRLSSRVVHKSNSSDKRYGEGHKHHEGGSNNHIGRRGHSGSEFSHSRHHSWKDARRHEIYEVGQKHHEGGSNYHMGRGGDSGSESSHSRHHCRRDARRHEPDALVSCHKYNRHLDSGLESSTSGGRKPTAKEKDFCHDSRPSKHGVKYTNEEQRDDKRKRVHSHAEDKAGDYSLHKQKRLL